MEIATISRKIKLMANIVTEIRECTDYCYGKEYNGDYSILKSCEPLIDDPQEDKKILFISQAPSFQAMSDGVLSSLENDFFTCTFLKRLFSYKNCKELEEIVQSWQKYVFWMHAANCYPGRANERNDKLPNMQCGKKFIGRVIDTLKPHLIILMGWSPTRFFSDSIKNNLRLNKKSLKDILQAQHEFHKKNCADFKVYTVYKTGGQKKATSCCPCIIIPHLAYYPSSEDQKHAVCYLSNHLKKEFGMPITRLHCRV